MADALPLTQLQSQEIARLRDNAERRRGAASPNVLVNFETQLRLLATLDAARADVAAAEARGEARGLVRAAEFVELSAAWPAGTPDSEVRETLAECIRALKAVPRG